MQASRQTDFMITCLPTCFRKIVTHCLVCEVFFPITAVKWRKLLALNIHVQRNSDQSALNLIVCCHTVTCYRNHQGLQCFNMLIFNIGTFKDLTSQNDIKHVSYIPSIRPFMAHTYYKTCADCQVNQSVVRTGLLSVSVGHNHKHW